MTPHDQQLVVVLGASIESVAVAQNELASFVASFPWVSDEDRMSFELALVELVANVIRYALTDDSSAQLQIIVSRDELRAHLSDDGHRFLGELDNVTMPAPEAESGRGLAVIMQLVDTFTYERRDGTNQWTIGLHLTPKAAPRGVTA